MTALGAKRTHGRSGILLLSFEGVQVNDDGIELRQIAEEGILGTVRALFYEHSIWSHRYLFHFVARRRLRSLSVEPGMPSLEPLAGRQAAADAQGQ